MWWPHGDIPIHGFSPQLWGMETSAAHAFGCGFSVVLRVVCDVYANVLPRPSIEIAISRRRTTVKTRLRRWSLSVSEPSVMRRVQGQTQQVKPWWSTPGPERGRGEGGLGNLFRASSGQGVYLSVTPLSTGLIAPLCGVAMTPHCLHMCSRSVIVSVWSWVSQITHCQNSLAVSLAWGLKQISASCHRLQLARIAPLSEISAGNVQWNLWLLHLWTLRDLTALFHTSASMMIRGVTVYCEFACFPNPFHSFLKKYNNVLYIHCTFAVLVVLLVS